jgi:hypothetical protein
MKGQHLVQIAMHRLDDFFPASYTHFLSVYLDRLDCKAEQKSEYARLSDSAAKRGIFSSCDANKTQTATHMNPTEIPMSIIMTKF